MLSKSSTVIIGNTFRIENVSLFRANASRINLILTEADIVALSRHTSANFLTERRSVIFELKPFDVRLGLKLFEAVSCKYDAAVNAWRLLEVADEGYHELAVGVQEEEAEDEQDIHEEDKPLALGLGFFLAVSHFVLK